MRKSFSANDEMIEFLKTTDQQIMIAIDNHDYAEALKYLQEFFNSKKFNEFSNCIKEKIYTDNDKKQREKMCSAFLSVFGFFLKLLHPFLPFITEEINEKLSLNNNCISISKWPEICDISNLKPEIYNLI